MECQKYLTTAHIRIVSFGFHKALWLFVSLWALWTGTAWAQTNAASYSITPPPAWVSLKGNEIPPSAGTSNQDEDLRMLLLDQQIHAGKEEHYRRVVRVLLNENGVQNGSRLSLPFDPTYQTFQLHSVKIWRNGQALNKLKPDEVKVIQQEKELSWHLYNGSVSVLLFLEDVRVGDIIDYAYTIKGQNPIFNGRFIESFDLGFSVPINQLKYRLLWPESRRLYLKKHLTTVEPTESKQNGLVEYSWDVNADQPLSLEDSLPLSYDPYPWVQLSEYADWSEVKDWALKLYQIPTEQSPEIIALTSAWQKSLPTAEERLLAVIQFVQDEVRYLGIEIGANTHRPTPPSVVLTRRFGDCKDKSLLLCALLRALGFEAYPALVSTGDRESIKDRHASPYVFNHVVVQLKHDGKEWWVDATSSGQRGKLEHRFFPAYGYALILRPDTKGLEPINTGTNGWPKTIITEKLLLRGKKESADLTIITRAEGVEAESLRDTLKSVRREELEKDYLNYYAKTYPKITQVKPMESTDDLTKNVVITTEHYRIDEAWEYSEKDKKHACEFYPQSLSSLLETPQTRLRSMPLGIDFPMHHVVRMEVQLPEPWPVETNHFSLHGHALHFEAHRTYGDNRLVMEYELRTLTNSIPAQLVAAHVKQVGEIEDHLGYSIFWGEENNTETKPVASFSPNWTIIFITILYGIILAAAIAWFFLKRKITPPPLPDAELLPYASTLTGIGGWLFLVAFGLIVNPFRMVSSITETFPAYTPESWSHLTLPGSEGYDWRWAPYLIISLLANETIVIWTLVNLILFFRRDRLFPISYICFMIATAVLVTLDQMMASQMPSAEKTTPEEMKELVRGYMLCFIWVPYFLRSKRVRLTFTN